MARAKQASKRTRGRKVLPAFGVAGIAGVSFSLAGAASASTGGPATDIQARIFDASRNLSRRGRNFRRELGDFLCLRQGNRTDPTRRETRLVERVRRLRPMRWMRAGAVAVVAAPVAVAAAASRGDVAASAKRKRLAAAWTRADRRLDQRRSGRPIFYSHRLRGGMRG